MREGKAAVCPRKSILHALWLDRQMAFNCSRFIYRIIWRELRVTGFPAPARNSRHRNDRLGRLRYTTCAEAWLQEYVLPYRAAAGYSCSPSGNGGHVGFHYFFRGI